MMTQKLDENIERFIKDVLPAKSLSGPVSMQPLLRFNLQTVFHKIIKGAAGQGSEGHERHHACSLQDQTLDNNTQKLKMTSSTLLTR